LGILEIGKNTWKRSPTIGKNPDFLEEVGVLEVGVFLNNKQ